MSPASRMSVRLFVLLAAVVPMLLLPAQAHATTAQANLQVTQSDSVDP